MINFLFLMILQTAKAGECVEQYFLSLKIKSASRCESGHALTTGSGVASPSVVALIGENPAGLAFNRKAKTHFAFSQQGSLRMNLMAVTGANNVGGGLGYHEVGNYGRSSVLSLGMAAKSDHLKLAFGASARLPISGGSRYTANYPEAASYTTLGFMLNPEGKYRFAMAAHDMGSINSIYALGLSSPFTKYAILVVDGLAKGAVKYGNNKFGVYKVLIKPALGFNFDSFQFSFGHNITVNSSSSEWAQSKVTAGVSFWINQKLRLVSYYNRLEIFYLGITGDLEGLKVGIK